jgi:hypothetical protein
MRPSIMARGDTTTCSPHLHPAQDEEEQPPQPELLEELGDGVLEDLPIPKRDISLPVFLEPHFSQATS